MRTTLTSIGVACALVAPCAIAGNMMGNPLIAIGENQPVSWTQALNNGRIRAINPATDGVPEPDSRFYATQGTAVFVPSALTPDLMVELGNETHQALVMQWNPLMQGEDLAVASWELDTMTGPGRANGLNLRRGMIHFSLGAPPGVWDIGVSLRDKNGNWAGWFMPMPPLNWTFQWIDLAGQPGRLAVLRRPRFDITNIVAIRLNEAGAMVSFPLPPPGSQPGFWDWNAFNSIIVTPTPAARADQAPAVLWPCAQVLSNERRARS